MGLLPFQEEPCERITKILQKKGSALDASDTGVGKTYVAVHAAKRLGLPTGIICPKSVIPSWERVCIEEGLTPDFILNYEKISRGGTPYLAREGKTFHWNFGGLVIWDEVHRCKSMTSLNSKMLIAAWRTEIIRCLLLSATAARNPCEMRAIGYVLGLHKGYDFYHWLFNNGGKKNRWNGVEWRGTQKQLEDIHHHIFPERGARLRVKDLGTAFPENQIIAEALDVGDNGEIDRTYKEAEKSLAELKEKQENDFPSAMTIILRARQKAELLKVPLLVEMAQDLLEENRSVVIFVNFNETLRLLAEYLKTDCVIKDQPADERAGHLSNFQSNARRALIANIQAGGVGISLHDTIGDFPRVSLICPTYNAVDLKQALGRIHRANGKSPCIQKLIYAAGTVEEKICKNVKQKLNAIDTINDNEVSDNLKWERLTTEVEHTASSVPQA